MSENPLEELFAVVRRELGATSAEIVDDLDTTEDDPTAVRFPIDGGRYLIAHLPSPPQDPADITERLEALVASFSGLLSAASPGHTPRPPRTQSLSDELVALVRRAGARVAVVIDAHSPIVWGSSTKAIRTLSSQPKTVLLSITDLASELEEPGEERAEGRQDRSEPTGDATTDEAVAAAGQPGNDGAERRLAEAAIASVRALPEIEGLRKGGHLNHQQVGLTESVIARSFASIYLLVVGFEGRLDELRAKRAIQLALPAIERLVLALPPLEPEPQIGGAAAMRLRRSRRR